MKKVVSIIYFHQLELFTTTDYGIKPSSSLQKPELHGLLKALLSTRWTITRIVIDFNLLFIFYSFCICNSAVFIVLYFIFTYILLYLYKLLIVCSTSELPVFNKFELSLSWVIVTDESLIVVIIINYFSKLQLPITLRHNLLSGRYNKDRRMSVYVCACLCLCPE